MNTPITRKTKKITAINGTYMGYRHLRARRTTTNATVFARMLNQRKVGTEAAKQM
jgi:hypothetical protein